MKTNSFLFLAAVMLAGVMTAAAEPAAAASQPVYVPDYTRAGEPLADSVIAWDAVMKTLDATNGQTEASLTFSFTNVSSSQVAVLMVHSSCSCTTAQLPPMPWLIQPGSNGAIHLQIKFEGKSGMLFKSVNILTDKGRKDLLFRINIPAPPAPAPQSAEERARGIAASTADRQAVFKGDCRACHVKDADGKHGKPLYDALCAICHESASRAAMVPDLRNIKTPTSEEYWRAWITSGKAGTLMPAFATSRGGPLTDMQIGSLAAYLNSAFPCRATNAPAE